MKTGSGVTNRELKDANLLTRQRAVMSLCDHLHDPEHIAEALNVGIAESLKNLLTDTDTTVRQKSTECLFVIGCHAIGRDAFLEHNIIPPVAKLFDDKIDIARKNAHKAIEMISETPPGAEGIVQADLIGTLVNKLKTEVEEIKLLILDTLHFCMRVDTGKALKADAMTVAPLEGKNKAVEVGCVAELVKLLADSSPDVKANAAGALMIITITTKGKYTALESTAIPPLVTLVDDPTSEVRANSLKALTCLSEAPEGRKTLLEHVDKIKVHLNDEIPAVARAAQIAVRVIEWKP
ncbi:RSP14-like protein [Mya arenaria]|uniref:RSP14-like protein n=1 Tax=Mya arenaria TaxID=6604 RepID=A0ABY7E3W3_MYAAR|nr:RSP14-like protein [Mya arenaria]